MNPVQLNFNASTVAPNKALDPIPAGWYNVKIVGSELKPTSKPGGQMLEFTMSIIDGPHAGRKLYDRLNIVNDNPVAVQIAYETLSAVCHAVGVIDCKSSDMLHGIPLKVKVKLRAATGQYEAANEVKGYDHINSAHDTVTNVVPGVAGAPAGVPAWAAAPNAQAAPQAAAPPVVAAPAYTPPTPAFVPPAAPNFAAPAPVAAAAPAPAAPAAPPAPAATGPVMLPAANGTPYEAYVANGWTDELLIAHGLMAAPVTAPPPPAAAPVPAAPAAPGAAPWAVR